MIALPTATSRYKKPDLGATALGLPPSLSPAKKSHKTKGVRYGFYLLVHSGFPCGSCFNPYTNIRVLCAQARCSIFPRSRRSGVCSPDEAPVGFVWPPPHRPPYGREDPFTSQGTLECRLASKFRKIFFPISRMGLFLSRDSCRWFLRIVRQVPHSYAQKRAAFAVGFGL